MIIEKRLTKILAKDLGPITFAMFMRTARSSMGMTQIKMAKTLKIATGTLCDIEKGRQAVSVKLASSIAKKAGLSIPQAVEAAIQDQIRYAKLNFKVKIVA